MDILLGFDCRRAGFGFGAGAGAGAAATAASPLGAIIISVDLGHAPNQRLLVRINT